MVPENTRTGCLPAVGSAWLVLGLALASASIYFGLAQAGDLRPRTGLLLSAHAALAAMMLACWSIVRRRPGLLIPAVAAALAFRLLAALGPAPSLSDDVYRYVWDGRVQVHGIQPYRYAPDDPALTALRDASWTHINHAHLATLYPPLAEMSFALLALCGAGASGFRLLLGLADFGVVLALLGLLARLERPRENLLLYAWSPLAVLETAGSGHVEPLGVLCLVLSAGWIVKRRTWLSTLALAASVDIKFVTGLLVPGHLRRAGAASILLFLVAVAVPFVPYALAGGPLSGTGLTAYAAGWEYNASIYAGVLQGIGWLESSFPIKTAVDALRGHLGDAWIPWDVVYRHAFPRDVARGLVASAMIGLALYLGLYRRLEAPREALWLIGGALLLSPTVHPWYLLWFLPFAAAYETWPWLAWGLLVPLAYCNAGGDVPWLVRGIEYAPVFALLAWRRSGRIRP